MAERARSRLQALRAQQGSQRARGVVLIALLLMLTLLAIGSLGAAEVWATARQRDREAELLFVGNQYKRAIEHYWRTGGNALPKSLDDLLLDDRFPMPVRHLRRPYRDPMTDSADWGLVMIGNGISGVYSRSDAPALKRANFPKAYAGFDGKENIADWKFVFTPPQRTRNQRLPAGAPGKPNANPTVSPEIPNSSPNNLPNAAPNIPPGNNTP